MCEFAASAERYCLSLHEHGCEESCSNVTLDCNIWHAGINSKEDLQLYSYEKSEVMSEEAAQELSKKLSDATLKSIFNLHCDKPASKRWITEYQNHRDNLPDDPTQVVLAR